MAKEEKILAQGTVLESLPNGSYRVQIVSLSGQDLGDNGMVVFGHVSGHMRKCNISLINGDRVDIELTHMISKKVALFIVITSHNQYESTPIIKT